MSYDVRGKLDEDLNGPIAYWIDRAFAQWMQPVLTISGQDIRYSSAELQIARNEGLLNSGTNVIDIGLCGTEEVYFTTTHFGAWGGLMVTASHNAIDYNGIKMVREESKPISALQARACISGRFEEQGANISGV